MSKKRMRYTPEFRREAVRLVVEQGLAAAGVADDLGVSRHTIYTWLQALREEVEAEGKVPQRSQAEEIRQLRKDLERARMERDILKKAAAYFASDSK